MARKYAVTRTVEKTVATALIFDKTTAEPSNVTVTLGHKFNDAAAIERAVRKIVEADSNIKLIEVVGSTTSTQLLGITEEDFLAHAVNLDPKTRKPLNA
jgi:hypothetical protein